MLDGFENGFGPGADAQVFGQIDPTDRTRGIYQELGRPCDVLAVFPAFGVQYAVPTNYLGFGVG